MIEQWKDVEGFNGVYQVSNTGKLRSVDRYVPRGINGKKVMVNGFYIATRLQKGYVCVALYLKDKRFGFSVHRLVATAFIPNTSNFIYA